MGRNEFPLNLEFIKEIDAKSYKFNEDNSNDLKDVKIYGSLNRSSIKSLSLYYNEKSYYQVAM